MSDASPLSPEYVTLVDTNAFISIGNPGASKYRRFRRAVRRAGVTLLIPARVEREIEQGGVTPAVDRAREEGWARVVDAPTISHGQATTARDITRRAIASKSRGKDEHAVEKADAAFAGLAVEYVHDDERADSVMIITADRVANDAITTALTSLGYGEQIAIVSVWDVIDAEDDEFTLI